MELGDSPGFVHIVDDDASFRKATERHLRQAGYQVATYASAQHLLDCLPSESVSGCILLDVRLPGLSEPRLQSLLSELGSTLPIVFLSGYPDIPITVQAIKAGADDFLTKPVSSGELLQAVERAIAQHEMTRGLKGKLDVVRAHVATDAAGGKSSTCHSQRHQQTGRARVGLYRTYHQGPSPQGDGENASSVPERVPCRADRRSCRLQATS